MWCFRALLVRRPFANQRPARNQRRPIIGYRRGNGAINILEIMSITRLDVPATGHIARCDIFAGRQIGRAVDSDPVIVPENDQTPQPQMPCKPNRFVVDALHQASITRNDPCAVINQFITEARVEMPFGHRHAYRHRQTLP